MRSLLVALVAFSLFIFAIHAWASSPIVYESFATGQCVEVYDPSGQYSCENFPERYTHEWRQ